MLSSSKVFFLKIKKKNFFNLAYLIATVDYLQSKKVLKQRYKVFTKPFSCHFELTKKIAILENKINNKSSSSRLNIRKFLFLISLLFSFISCNYLKLKINSS